MRLPRIFGCAALFTTLSLAHPGPVRVCNRNCTPEQIENAFRSPWYLDETKEFCRRSLAIKDEVQYVAEEVKVVVTQVVGDQTK